MTVYYLPSRQEVADIAKQEGESIDEEVLLLLDNDVLPYSEDESKVDPVKIITNASTLAKDFADLGEIIFEKYAKHFGVFGAVAGILKDIIEISEPTEKDPVLKELGFLRNQLDVLSHKMTAQFDELKGFVVEQQFFRDFANKSALLFDYMTDTLKDLGEISLNKFKNVYEEKRPERFVREMLVILESEVSNPLKVNVSGQELPKKAMFAKWKKILESTLTQFLILESFAQGLLHPNDKSDFNKCVEKILRYMTLVRAWEDHYLNNRLYWDKLKGFVRRIQTEEAFPAREDKAQKIFDEMKTVITKDIFYVVVFDNDVPFQVQERKGDDKSDHFILSTNCGPHSVVVFRYFGDNYQNVVSRVAETLDKRFRRLFGTSGWFQSWHSALIEYLSGERVLEWLRKSFWDARMMMLVASENVSIRHQELSGAKWGPGYWIFDDSKITMDFNFGQSQKTFKIFQLVVL